MDPSRVPPDVVAEFKKMQEVIASLQQELSALRSGQVGVVPQTAPDSSEADAIHLLRAQVARLEEEARGSGVRETKIRTFGMSSDMLALTNPSPMGLIQTRNSRYGLRGVRIGEASHPGPPEVQRRIGPVNSAHHDDVHPTLLDDLERDLTPASTVPASSAVGHVDPTMVDLTMMDTASDTSQDSRRAVVQVLARRGRRLRTMGTQPTVADLHTPNRFSAVEEGEQEHSCHSF